jgi:mono/diheme cytochrome c family protein
MRRFLASVFLAGLVGPAIAAEPSAEHLAFFEKNVRPVLVTQCADCHGPDDAQSKLRVDSLAGLLAGGERGPAIVPGRPSESLLLSAVKHEDVLQMPPKQKLSAKQIADIAKWIETGAAWPGMSAEVAAAKANPATAAILRDEDRAFWSFQSPRAAEPPPVRDTQWARSPIDRFILAELEAKDLRPAPQADKLTLVRRATFDLTGLPPTPDEVERFVRDLSPDAYERLLDRLLASPHYGERWGRHWLDVARYADSNGMDENLAFINAYRYRDYVVNAFNSDKPYDRFVAEQLAGDLLSRQPGEPDEANFERLTATGFLSIGPKMLADDDPKKKEMDIIDEQLDTLGKAFLGLTLGCARCHDHKFDPLSAGDYYSLAGILKSTKTMENFRVVANWNENALETAEQTKTRLEYETRLKAIEAKIARRKAAADAEAMNLARRRAGDYVAAASELVPLAADGTAFKPKLALDKLARERKLDPTLLKQWVNHVDRKVRGSDTIYQPFVEYQRRGQDSAALAVAAKSFQTEADRAIDAWEELLKTNKRAAKLDDSRLDEYRSVLFDGKIGPIRATRGFNGYEPTAKTELAAIEQEKAAIVKAAPPMRRAMGVREGEIQNVRIHYRGNHTTLGPEVPRQFPRVLAGERQTPIDGNQSGRLQLAQWLTQPDHPLTARVMVNRIWRWHFGRGLVRTVDNFGKLGERPTNQPLLDWLAVEFVKSGWSMKALHRLIMQSSVYQMSTQFDAQAAAADPENLLYWRFERRRLEAEEVHDALLAVGGRLDRTLGGTTTTFKEREYVSGTGSRVLAYNSARRTIYLPVLRSAVYEVLQAFDFADPSTLEGNRATTTVAPQALFMMNGKLVAENATALAESLLERGELDDAARVRAAFAAVLNRPATRSDVDRSLQFVRELQNQAGAEASPADVRRSAWGSLCRVLLASNEFIYVE